MVPAMLLAAVAAITGSVSGPPSTVGAPPPSVVVSSWGWPLEPRPAVTRPFRAPPTPWSAGHRGVDLAARVGQPVLAAGAGRIVFAGPVAGRGVVVVAHAGGLRTSYEPVDHRPRAGGAVVTGSPIGVVGAVAGHCAPQTCLHWGLRRGDTYLDPLSLVHGGPVVLLPVPVG